MYTILFIYKYRLPLIDYLIDYYEYEITLSEEVIQRLEVNIDRLYTEFNSILELNSSLNQLIYGYLIQAELTKFYKLKHNFYNNKP